MEHKLFVKTRLHNKDSFKTILKAFTLVMVFLIMFMSGPAYNEASIDWSIENVQEKLESNEGVKQLLKAFQSEQHELKSRNLELYYYVKGINYFVNDDYKFSQASFEKALEYSIATENVHVQIESLKMLIVFSEFYADSGELIDYGSLLLDLAGEQGDVEAEMYAYYTLALAFYYVANDEKAFEYLDLMLYLAENENNNKFQGVYFTMMGHIYYSYFEFETALEYYEEATNFMTKDNANILYNIQIGNQASIRLTQSRLPHAEERKEETLAHLELLIKEAQKDYYHTLTLMDLYLVQGQIEREYNLTEQSVQSFEQAKYFMESITHVEKVYSPYTYINQLLARAYYENGDYRQAADVYIEISMEDENPGLFQYIDDVSSKVRNYTERELNDRIALLTDLQEAQHNRIQYQTYTIILSVIVITLLVVGFLVIVRKIKKVNLLKNKMYYQSITDELTGIYNRRKIFEILVNEKETSSVVALIDIDNFKQINDSLGYLIGDEVLKTVVETIKESIRKNDDIGRYGGEEFIIILRDIDFDEAINLLEVIRKTVESLEWQYNGLRTSVSIGVAKNTGAEAEDIFREVDRLVHEAKRTGKNKLVYNDYNK